MVANQKKYTDEFSRETAGYAISTGRPITRVCEELGLNPKTANDRVLKRRRELGGEPDPRAEDRGLHETKRRIRELEMGNAFGGEAVPAFPRGTWKAHRLARQRAHRETP